MLQKKLIFLSNIYSTFPDEVHRESLCQSVREEKFSREAWDHRASCDILVPKPAEKGHQKPQQHGPASSWRLGKFTFGEYGEKLGPYRGRSCRVAKFS